MEGVSDAKVEVVWDPPWTPEKMSEAARLQLSLQGRATPPAPTGTGGSAGHVSFSYRPSRRNGNLFDRAASVFDVRYERRLCAEGALVESTPRRWPLRVTKTRQGAANPGRMKSRTA